MLEVNNNILILLLIDIVNKSLHFCLKVLSLKSCEIEFAGGEAIGLGLQRNSGLKELYLNSNKLKDAGSKEIAQGIKVSETLVVIVFKNIINNDIINLFIFK